MAVDGGSDSEAGTADVVNDRKIRDSCNACSSHKIRCTKERPACRRCASKGLQCEYSVSRRNGKRRRSDGISLPENSTPGIMSSAFALDDFDQLCDMNFGAPGISRNIGDDSWMLAGTTTNAEETRVSIPAAGVRDVDETAYLHQHSSEGFAAPAFFGRTQDFFRSTTLSALHGRGEDCTARALGIVMQMHIAPKMCSAPDSISMMRSEARDIDTVLQVNRAAIATLNSILDCSACSSDHMCMLTCYLAAQKTVAWYAAILGIDSGGHGTDLAGLVGVRTIFMGTFALGREAQRLVHASVILTEVRDHVQPLVERLSREPSPACSCPLPSPIPSPASASASAAAPAAATSCGGIAESSACKLRDQIASILARASPLHA